MKPAAPFAILALVVLFALPLGAQQESGEPRIREVSVALDGHLVRVGFQLEGAVTADFVERLESGLPTGFVYRLELLKDRKRWFDQGVERSTLQVFAMYDAATRGYLVNYKLDGKLIESRLVRGLPDLARAMTVIDALPAFQSTGLPRSWRLLVRVQADIGPRTLLGVLPTRQVTEWRESRKFRPPAPPEVP
ncbi:MAG TPA: DUF4390 domain-containing protein [Thermoanaerobaculia bacterium]|nr:DUF4390 domain-containing protein [Thermoanaerobaculia bacterium]